ncbi:hypothetical protein CTM50_00190 [Prevotella intermedia]|uniref:Uncharacterized protein n=1 Tax=Prevotella intermedia TaxID=28131 RepID=A0A2D3N890_PREIN|nr:hypothetical protein CTM50_00190 [Prevotella intermedia]
MLYRSDITSFFIDFFVLNELTQTPLQKIPSNPQKDIEQSAKRYRAIRKKIPTSKIKTAKLVENLAVLDFQQ